MVVGDVTVITIIKQKRSAYVYLYMAVSKQQGSERRGSHYLGEPLRLYRGN